MAQHIGKTIEWQNETWIIVSYCYGLDTFLCRQVGRQAKYMIPVEEAI